MDLGSILTIIGYFAPVIFEKFVDLIKNHGDDNPDLQDALKKLEICMQEAMVIPHIRVDTNYGLIEKLKKLKETLYEADDLLDDLNYLRLKKQAEEDDNVDNHSSRSKCKKAELMSMVGLQAFDSIEALCVWDCPKLVISRSTTTCSGAVVLKDDTVDQEEAASTLRVRELMTDDPALLTVLLKSTQSLHYLQSLAILECELTYLNIEEEICSHLTALKKLKISYCLNLESLQPAYLKSLPSLEELYVQLCPKLQSLPLMPASLKTLSIEDCDSLRKGRYQEGGEDWHNIAHVNNIIWEDRPAWQS